MKLAYVFPGQGAQYIGMCKSLVDSSSAARAVFEEASDVLGFDMKSLVFDGSIEDLTMSHNAQPAIVTASYALYTVFFEETGIVPDFCAGHSLGEISALVAAGGMKFSDAISFVRRRGSLMHEMFLAKAGSMALVMNMPFETIESEVRDITSREGVCVISGYNSPGQILVSGTKNAVRILRKKVLGAGGEFVPLSMVPMKVDAPFHSPLMDGVCADIRGALDSYSYLPLRCAVISNVTALPYATHEDIPANLTLQMTSPVQWHGTLNYLAGQGVTTIIDIGPQYVMKQLAVENCPAMQVFSMDIESDVLRVKHLYGADPAARSNIIGLCMREASATPNKSALTDDQYREMVAGPYAKLRELSKRSRKEQSGPCRTDVDEAIRLLVAILKAKMVDAHEMREIADLVINDSMKHVREYELLYGKFTDEHNDYKKNKEEAGLD